MRRRGFILFFVGSAILLAIFAVRTTAFAQGGSTGGTIGKQNKSVSGSEAQPRQAAPTCQQLSDRYGISAYKSWGTADSDVQSLWVAKKCNTHPR
jgi:hypothetical protein